MTSNRDEHISRPRSYKPKAETINNCKVIFPKDPKAGGTWIAVNENGVGTVLLNGAFERHVPTGNYAKSRGLILLEIITSESPSKHLDAINLDNIEPFTLILFNGSALIEFRWDGKDKYKSELNPNKNHIWSSATLYTKEAIAYRKRLFDRFISNHNDFNKANIVEFHSNNNDDYENGFVINRDNTLKTFSITQLVFEHNQVELNHYDLLKEEKQTLKV